MRSRSPKVSNTEPFGLAVHKNYKHAIMTHVKDRMTGTDRYREAGVDIDAGNALVKAIAPLARSTARPGASGALGGFGGLFDLEEAGSTSPVLVAATDGVGTKLQLLPSSRSAQGRRYRSGGDVRQRSAGPGRRASVFPRLLRKLASSTPLAAKDVVAGIAEGCRAAGAR